jgi:shikimate dehydrogenase
VGNPIAHSKSPLIHAAFARQTGQDLIYSALLAPLDGFPEVVEAFRAGGGHGMNVTVPFKQQAYRLATRLTERARLAEAVNTLKFEADGILGDNTDGTGLVADISVNLRLNPAGRRILLMGAGGAARGVLGPLLQTKPATLFIANRTPDKAVLLARQFSVLGSVQGGGFEDLAGRRFDLVINATAAGLTDDLPPLPEAVFAEAALAYDLMYGKDTPFMKFARHHRVSVADGLGMLVEQAAEAFYLWRGVRPATAPVIAELRGQ